MAIKTKKMKVFFRTDASLKLGSGHVMRCLTLADELRLKKCNVFFVCSDLPGNLISFIERKGYPVYKLLGLSLSHSNILDWWEDAIQTANYIQGIVECADWVVVDHYGLDISWELSLRKYTQKIMVIDDLANRSHECDVLLDQNYYPNFESRYENLVCDQCMCLLGPYYALLRQEFSYVQKKLLHRSGYVYRILISFGGMDFDNLTAIAFRAVSLLNQTDITIDIVIGESNPHKEKLIRLCNNLPRVFLHVQSPNIADLMLKADIAIGGGGTTSWERCALGLPALLISLADNQKAICEGLSEKGCILYLGDYKDITVKRVFACLKDLMSEPLILKKMAKNCINLVDSKGCKRVASQMVTVL